MLGICLFSWRYSPVWLYFSQPRSGLYPPHSRGFLITLNDAPQSVGLLWTSDQSVAETSDNTQQTNIHAPGGIRTHNLSGRAAADLRLRPRGHWDRHVGYIYHKNYTVILSVRYIAIFPRADGETTHNIGCGLLPLKKTWMLFV